MWLYLRKVFKQYIWLRESSLSLLFLRGVNEDVFV
nr:MAG TPA: hypothetical protein [Caudoviricetes sp.]